MRDDKKFNAQAFVVQQRSMWQATEAPSKALQRKPEQFFENRICLTISEVSFALGTSPKSVERLIKSGALKAKRAGRRVLIPRSDIEAWLQKE